MLGLQVRIDEPPAYMYGTPPVSGPWYCQTRASHPHSTEWEAHLCAELARQVNRLAGKAVDCDACGRELLCPRCDCGEHCHRRDL
jgi:hypothetical protein